MPMVIFPNGNHNPSRFPCFEDPHHFIGLGVRKVGIDKVAPSSFWSFQDGRAPFLAKVLDPVLKLLSYVAQTVACNPLAIAISVKETDHPFRPLEGLNQTIE